MVYFINLMKEFFFLIFVFIKHQDENNQRVILEDLFKTIDANNDGFINFDEFFRIMNKFNPNISLKEVNSLFNKIDKDENGMISFEGN